MASKAHQFIADLVARRMYMDGYNVVSFEGYSETEIGFIALPPKIIRHRPDLIGIKDGKLVIGEAKTKGDLGTRTHEQIEDYIAASKTFRDLSILIYLGVPSSVERKIQDIVSLTEGEDKVTILAVPDRLLPKDYD